MKQKLLNLLFLFTGLFGIAQTPGGIFQSATPDSNPLNPNGDAWITASGTAFVTDDQTESEIAYIAIPQVSSEPSGDLATGSSCGPTDIVDNPSTGADGSYFSIQDPDGNPSSGDELLLFRLRIATDPGNGAFGFSVLVDTDILFGAADPNSVNGNPGFEYEIRLKSGGGAGVFVDDVDGTTNGTNITSFSIGTNSQRSYALSQDINCNNTAVFYDFFITLSSIGLTDTSNFRLIAATASAPGSVLGGSASDIGGIDDNDPFYNGDQDLVFNSSIEEQGTGLNNETLSVKSREFFSNLLMYPNPSSSIVTVKTSAEIENILIYNIIGKQIFKTKNKSFNLSSLQSGVYLIKVITQDGNVAIKRLIKK